MQYDIIKLHLVVLNLQSVHRTVLTPSMVLMGNGTNLGNSKKGFIFYKLHWKQRAKEKRALFQVETC